MQVHLGLEHKRRRFRYMKRPSRIYFAGGQASADEVEENSLSFILSHFERFGLAFEYRYGYNPARILKPTK